MILRCSRRGRRSYNNGNGDRGVVLGAHLPIPSSLFIEYNICATSPHISSRIAKYAG